MFFFELLEVVANLVDLLLHSNREFHIPFGAIFDLLRHFSTVVFEVHARIAGFLKGFQEFPKAMAFASDIFSGVRKSSFWLSLKGPHNPEVLPLYIGDRMTVVFDRVF